MVVTKQRRCLASTARKLAGPSTDKLVMPDRADKLVMADLTAEVDYIIYYHIFANEGNSVLRIFEEQVETILASPFFPKIKQIRCCLTGSDTTNFNMLLKRIGQLDKYKFVLRRVEFGNRIYEKFTFYCIRDDVMKLARIDQKSLQQTYICYIHTKGITKDIPQVTDWRRCMEYFFDYHS